MNRNDTQQRHVSPALANADAATACCPQAEYSVTWTIELTAGSARAAAEQAQAIQRDTKAISTVFDVRCLEDHTTVRIDLADADE